MKPLFVPYVNPMSNRDSFPSDKALKNLYSGTIAMGYEHAPDHEPVIQHALLANHVSCSKSKIADKYMACIFSNLVVLPQQHRTEDELLTNAYRGTVAMITSLLNNIPGFKVDIVTMLPEDLTVWLKNFRQASLDNKEGEELYGTMKSGMWYVQYTWNNPFKLRTDLTPWDVASNYLYDTIRQYIHYEGYEGIEGLQQMLELDLIKIEQHPYAKGSFSVLFNKQTGDRCFAPCLGWFGNHSQVYESGKNDIGLTNLFYISNECYIGSWYAIKETGEKQYLRLDN